MRGVRIIALTAGLLAVALASARPLSTEDVPQPLKPWVPWVLHGEEHRRCPFLYDDAMRLHCAWPGALSLTLAADGGAFRQAWTVAHEGWVPLPGDARHWPQAVTVNGEPGLVTFHAGGPSLYLPAGKHRLTGSFQWKFLPEFLRVPERTGLLELSLDGNAVPFPQLDLNGRLWLADREGARETREGITNTLDLRVYRRLVDGVPLTVVTRLELGVSGEPRESAIGPVLLPDYIPLSLDSPLPARLEPDGRLRLQVRPGQWTVTLTARGPGPVTEITAPETTEPWPAEEVWVFDARNHLRLVTVEGVDPVDPRQTTLPDAWRSLPAYRVGESGTMRLVQKRRGDPEPEPDRLSLSRKLWLDFDGTGYTVKDQISGTLTRGWRLEANPPLALGRVVVDGAPQFITRLPDSPREGVEVRRGRVTLVADSRLEETVSRIPAVGWQQDFQALSAVLHLPPGWQLFAASGADRVNQTWLTRWSLLDLFLVLIIAAAVGKLWGWTWGGLALVTLALVYHEPAAPRQVWLHLLAAVALLRVLPSGRFRRFVTAYRWLAVATLAVVGLPFLVDQVRIALYPTLERPWDLVGLAVTRQAEPKMYGIAPLDEMPEAPAAEVRGYEPAEDSSASYAKPRRKQARISGGVPVEQFDPQANVQTGPGLPSWSWRSVRLTWNGPVESGQALRLYFIPPWLSSLLRLLSVLLVAVLAWRVIDLRYRRGKGLSLGTGVTAAVVLVAPLYVGIPQPVQAEMPSEALLKELKSRLLEPPECLPACVQSPRLHLEVTPGTLRARMDVHSLADTAVPLPGHPDHWLPRTVLLDGKPAEGLLRNQAGQLWVYLGEGRRQLMIAGPLPRRDTVQLPLPLLPRKVSASLQGWTLDGLDENGLANGQLQLTRIREAARQPEEEGLEASVLPPFVRVERTLQLGLEWRVQTRVNRVSPVGTAVLLEAPLLEGESVTTAGVRVERGQVMVNMLPGQQEFAWQSILDKRQELTLSAPRTTSWTEVWRLDVSPIWHAELDGIPVVHHQSRQRWLPEWRPWPGEAVTVHITRPRGVEGRTLTIDSSQLLAKPGQRATDTELQLSLRSSQGSQHRLTLPEDATLQSVSINGTAQPIRQEGRSVTLPVTPGRQQVRLAWRQSEGSGTRFTTPAVNLGTDSVNATVQIEVPRGRWVWLVGGPRVGPAVLLWGILLVIALVAVGLGRVRITPLRTHHWLLLGVGLTQIPVWAALIVVGWLFALGFRHQLPEDVPNWRFNLMQIGLGLLTLIALGLLFHAVEQGLLGTPDMQIAGNGSTAHKLRWYQDRMGADLPQAWVVSLPLYVYRFLMLAWALWLAFALIGWLRWAWGCYSKGGLWRSVKLVRKRPGSRQDKQPTPQTSGRPAQ